MFFLKANDLAYTTPEIVFELTGYGRHVTAERAPAALDELVRDLRVEVSVFEDGSRYYKYDRRIGFRAPR